MDRAMLLFVIIVIAVMAQAHDFNEVNMQILSRKRRYLVFPEGSSLQLVYDQIIPVVDYTNFLIFGVTVAMAWELPVEPISMTKLQEVYQNHTLPLLKRLDPVDENDVISVNEPVRSSTQRPQNSYYNKRIEAEGSSYLKTDVGGNTFRYENVNKKHSKAHRYSADSTLDQINDFSGKKYKPWKASQWTKDTYIQRNPYVYAGVTKRSTFDTSDTTEKQLYVDHHRASRFKLYDTIVKYLIAHGMNGKECVQKALCETYQKKDETEPGSIIGEIIRVIFSLPPSDGLRNANSVYEDANLTQGNCIEKYPKCKESVWQADFIH